MVFCHHHWHVLVFLGCGMGIYLLTLDTKKRTINIVKFKNVSNCLADITHLYNPLFSLICSVFEPTPRTSSKTPALRNLQRSCCVCSFVTVGPKWGFTFNCECSQLVASAAVKQFSYCLNCLQCLLRGTPLLNILIASFHWKQIQIWVSQKS